MTREALILVAHGSRHHHVVDALRAIATTVAHDPRVAGRYAVDVAFLDHVAPTLTQVCSRLAAQGCTHAVGVPLLFTDAFHARVDVPAQVRAAYEASGLVVSIAPGLGTGGDIAALVEQRCGELARSVLPVEDVAGVREVRVLYSVGSSDAVASDAVDRLAASVGALSVVATGCRPHGGAEVEKIVANEVASGVSSRVVVLVQPLFVAPGILWSWAVQELSRARSTHDPGSTQSVEVRCGTPLGVDLATIIGDRACAVWSGRVSRSRPAAA